MYLYSTKKVDEMEELRQNNTAVSVLMSIVLVGITLSVQPSLERFIFSLVNYDTSEQALEEEVPEPQQIIVPKKIEPKK